MGGNSITPYFHILEHHVIEMIERSPFKSISHFQLQGQESKHQDHTTTLFRCSNWRENKSYSILKREMMLMYLKACEENHNWPIVGPKRLKSKVPIDEVLY